MSSVLDASALLAYLLDEQGAQRVEDALAQGCVISAVNWAEVLSKLVDGGKDPDEVSRELTRHGALGQGLRIRDLDEEQAREIARLRALTRTAGPNARL